MKPLLIFILLAALSTGELTGAQSIIPGANRTSPPALIPGVPQAGQSGVALPNVDLYALDSDNSLWLMRCGASKFNREINVQGLRGNLIGIDFRPADGNLYGLDDLGNLYLIDTDGRVRDRGQSTLISAQTPRFAGGYQSLMDFNPVVDAIRLIGSNDQNYAVVSNGGTLNLTVMQTAISYAAGDPSAGIDPNLVGGAYTNNLAGAATTIFYGIDFDLDNLVTIAGPQSAAGSSNTGGGKLQTIGALRTFAGNPVNLSPAADIDIYTDAAGNNYLIGLSGRQLFTIDLAQLLPNPIGTTQPVLIRSARLADGGFIDIAATASRRKCGR